MIFKFNNFRFIEYIYIEIIENRNSRNEKLETENYMSFKFPEIKVPVFLVSKISWINKKCQIYLEIYQNFKKVFLICNLKNVYLIF